MADDPLAEYGFRREVIDGPDGPSSTTIMPPGSLICSRINVGVGSAVIVNDAGTSHPDVVAYIAVVGRTLFTNEPQTATLVLPADRLDELVKWLTEARDVAHLARSVEEGD